MQLLTARTELAMFEITPEYASERGQTVLVSLARKIIHLKNSFDTQA